jgi:hypothetical protein
MFEALHKANVNIQIITTSEIKVTCVVRRDDTEKAVLALHSAFDLGRPPTPRSSTAKAAKPRAAAKSKAAARSGAGKKAPRRASNKKR